MCNIIETILFGKKFKDYIAVYVTIQRYKLNVLCLIVVVLKKGTFNYRLTTPLMAFSTIVTTANKIILAILFKVVKICDGVL